MRLLLFSFLLLFYLTDISATTNLITEDLNESNSSQVILSEEQIAELKEKSRLEKIAKEKREKLALQRVKSIQGYKEKLALLENDISNKNSWIKSYASYITSLEVRTNLQKINRRIEQLSKSADTLAEHDELNALISKKDILTSQVEKLKSKGEAPFSELITPPSIGKIDDITNPFDIFTGFSTIKTLNANFDEYKQKRDTLMKLIILLRKEKDIYKALTKIDENSNYKIALAFKKKQLENLETALDTMNITLEVYQKRIEIVINNINKGIEKQIYGVVKISIIIFVVIFIFFLLKLVVKKYITDNERFYMANKIITFTNFIFIIFILFFNYIENASYLITILGFASAGIAIAMKDWFMSILGWLVIVIGGSVHVGDRIRVDMDGMKYVGDVLDISLLRMTILEDITLTSIMQNRRAGRIIFIPNNYVFTRMIANYTHQSLKTVWDGVKITITFDSNHKKAMHIAKEITRKYSKGYTEITRKQLNKLRHNYSLKNTNVEPRIFSFIETNGMDIEAWYLTNAYGTLTLRSVISTEIVTAFNAEDDITIAYPTQKLYIEKEAMKPPFDESEELV